MNIFDKNKNDILKIPNLFTLLNMLCGIISIFFAIDTNFSISGILILLGMLFDFLDGYSARLLNQQSEFGKELDSFADIITFGLSPAILVFVYNYKNMNIILQLSLIIFILSIIYRLSRYNLDYEKQKNVFSGLPSTFSGGFIAFLVLWFPIIFSFQYSFLLFIFLASVSNIPYKKFRINNFYQSIILIIFVFLYLIFKKYLILIIFILYILSGFLNITFDFIKRLQKKIQLKNI